MSQGLAARRADVDVELVDAFDEQALAIASSCAAPNTRRAYATAYRAFAAFLRDCYGEASTQTFTLAAVAASRDELAQRVSAVRRLAAAIGADALVQQVRCTQIQHSGPGRCRTSSSPGCSHARTGAPRSGRATARSSSCSRALDSGDPNSLTCSSATCRSAVASPTHAGARRSRPAGAIRHRLRSWYARPSAAGRGRCPCMPRHTTRCGAGTPARPAAASDALFVSLRQRRTAVREGLSASTVGDVV